ncbi:hypothetical protein [Lewinella sp. IMCC34191]|uniref:hypothetical protein n=1 Tax=Lewinella sp. IMCC34191 TaxID=2259172 RepID=UPI000E27F855|nr:hypothetical protein [Lewinella sp. IMCC34191]
MSYIPPKTRQQIADEYGVHVLTLMRQLQRLDISLPSGSVLPAYQKLIYLGLGFPSGICHDGYLALPIPPVNRISTATTR